MAEPLFSFKGYDNFVLAEQIESILNTKLDMTRFMTVDYSLTENAGMKKIIHKYTGTGSAQDLARGEGNTEFVDAEYTPVEYTVARTQGMAQWYLDDIMNDPKLVEAKLQYLSEGLVNSWNGKAVAEFDKTENQYAYDTLDLGAFADALNKIEAEWENVDAMNGYYFLANVKMVPAIRKFLGANLVYVTEYVRSGYIGNVLGLPIYTSKIVPEGIIFLANREAVTAFMKRNLFVEQDHDINTKLDRVAASRYSVIALTDEKKCVKIGKAQATELTATADVSDGTVAGNATTGAVVTAYDENGNELGHATAAGGTYSISCTVPEAGSEVKVVAKKDGFLPSIIKVESVA